MFTRTGTPKHEEEGQNNAGISQYGDSSSVLSATLAQAPIVKHLIFYPRKKHQTKKTPSVSCWRQHLRNQQINKTNQKPTDVHRQTDRQREDKESDRNSETTVILSHKINGRSIKNGVTYPVHLNNNRPLSSPLWHGNTSSTMTWKYK